MKPPFLARRSVLGLPNALIILLVIFFLVPFGLRGARQSLGRTENNVKDWLPSDFRETSELAWFGQYFAGERFVLATWPGATADDQRLKLFERKLQAEAAGSTPAELPDDWAHAREVAEELRLMLPANLHKNWGGRDEKWLISEDGQWYFVTPDGRLYRWAGEQNAVGATVRAVKRMLGMGQAEGQFLAAFGGKAGERVANPYYNDPALLTAALLKTVQSGPQVARQLAAEGGSLWPRDTTDPEIKPVVARRRAYERLTGTLFAPAVPESFPWTPEAFAAQLPKERRAELPENFAQIIQTEVQRIVDQHYGGQLQRLRQATNNQQADHWYQVFDALEIAPPARQTAIVITLTELGQRNLPYVVGRGVLGGPRGRILQLAEQSGLEAAPSPSAAPPPFNRRDAEGVTGRPPLRLGGPPVDNVAIDEEGTITLVRLVGYSILVGLGLSYLCFRSIRITVMVFFVGGVSAVFSLAIVWWSGSGMDAILMSMPSLVYVLGMSGAIHVVNYYRDEVHAHGEAGAAGRALRHAWWPCTLAALTTAIGLMSLYTSNIIPIRKFGWFSAVGVVATLAVLFTYLPAALETFAAGGRARRDEKKEELEAGSIGEGGLLARFWMAVGEFIVRRHTPVAIGCVLVLAACTMGIWKIRTSVQLLKMFDDDSRIIRDYAWLEENFGKLVPMELVVRIPPQALPAGANTAADAAAPAADVVRPLSALERVEAVSRVQTVVEQAFGEAGLDVVGRAMSAATFLPPLPEPSNSYDVERAAFNRELSASREELLGSDYVRIEAGGPLSGSELWRISLRVSALSDVDYGRFIYQLRRAVEPVLEAYRTRDEVLQSLEQTAADKPRVLMLGRDRPQPLGVEPVLSQPPSDAVAADADAAAAVDSQAIFDATLWELLQNERIPQPVWFDPAAPALAGKLGETENWGKLLAQMDTVVLLREHPDLNVDFIRQHAKHLVDARGISTDRAVPAIVDGVPVPQDAGPLQVVYTGVVPVVYKAQRTLLYSLVESIAWAFVLIAGVMAVLLNPGSLPLSVLKPRNLAYGVTAGLVAMLPNIFPVAVIFGLMGHLDIVVDIGTMMTASVAMGVAVDDTIHFLSWFRQYLNDGMDRRQAIVATYRRVAPAMTQTTLVGGLGLFVFALSTFTPTQRFGTLMLVLLAAALVGDLLFLPALLAGPLGRLFRPKAAIAPGATRGPEELVGSHMLPPHDAEPSSAPDRDESRQAAAAATDGDGATYRTDHPHRKRGARQSVDRH